MERRCPELTGEDTVLFRLVSTRDLFYLYNYNYKFLFVPEPRVLFSWIPRTRQDLTPTMILIIGLS